MAEPIWLKLSGIIKDSAENDLAKEFFLKNSNIKTFASKIAWEHWVQSIPLGWIRLILGGLITVGDQDI